MAQEQMLTDYEATRDIKHPRDVGDAREHILQDFLQKSGYLPKVYGVSDRSVRIVSTTGHLSGEIDIALYDPLNALTLMKRQDTYQVYPVESIYGVIQVKSTLTKKELTSGLKNIASFKKLDRSVSQRQAFVGMQMQTKADRGFGLLFAYTTNMKWLDIIQELKTHAESAPQRQWPNAVFILDRGMFLYGEENQAQFFNRGIEAITALKMHGFPDRQGICLYQFQSILLDLLRHTSTDTAELNSYFQLPLIAEGRSYSFTMGMFAEVGHCAVHGDFARQISPEALEKLTTWCQMAAPINWIKANDIAYGNPEDEEAYRRQPGDVRIYNPENLPLSDILLQDAEFAGKKVRSLAYDSIDAAGMTISLPHYYAAKEDLISGCSKCKEKPARRRNKKG